MAKNRKFLLKVGCCLAKRLAALLPAWLPAGRG